MKLYELIKMSDGNEITVFDKDYDMETYFYKRDSDSKWDIEMEKLSKLLEVTNVSKNGVTVDLSTLIESRLQELKKTKLFIRCNIDSIMMDIDNILSGNVSEDWLERFVDTLGGNK